MSTLSWIQRNFQRKRRRRMRTLTWETWRLMTSYSSPIRLQLAWYIQHILCSLTISTGLTTPTRTANSTRWYIVVYWCWDHTQSTEVGQHHPGLLCSTIYVGDTTVIDWQTDWFSSYIFSKEAFYNWPSESIPMVNFCCSLSLMVTESIQNQLTIILVQINIYRLHAGVDR